MDRNLTPVHDVFPLYSLFTTLIFTQIHAKEEGRQHQWLLDYQDPVKRLYTFILDFFLILMSY